MKRPNPALRWAAASLLIAALSSIAVGAQAGVLGVALDGQCEAGTCPPAAAAFNTSNSLPFTFQTTLANGDQYKFVGKITSTNNSNGSSLGASEAFTVQYLGGPSGNSGADTLNLQLSFSWHLSFSSGTGSFVTGTSGAFSNDIATGSSVTFTTAVAGTDVLSLGPFVDPANNPFSGTSGFNYTFTSNTYSSEDMYTLFFAAGSAPGSFIDINDAPIPSPVPTPTQDVPEPSSLTLLLAALALALGLSGYARTLGL